MRYLSLDELIGYINRPTREEIRRVLHENRLAFEKAQGSRYNHQAWPGGYIDHITETMNLARVFHQALNEHRSLPFSLSDALIALFFHDIEKPFRHELVPGDFAGSKDDRKAWFLAKIVPDLGMSNEVHNAIFYAEGEKDSYSPSERKMGPLAAFVHLCDITSARLWFDRPRELGDTWGERMRS